MITERPFGQYANERVVVLGAAGFIGSWISRYLTSAQAELHLVVRDRPKAGQIFSRFGIHGTIWIVDLSDLQQARDILMKLQPSIVFNLAGYGVDRMERDETTAQQINVQLVETIGQALLHIPKRGWQGMNLVHVGSALEYGEIGGDLAEASDPNPTTLYGRTKLQGTCAVQQYGQAHELKAVTARLFTVYGPGEHPGRLLPSLLRASQTGEVLPLTNGTQTRDFIYVQDVAEGLLRLGLASAVPGEIVNLATGQLNSVRYFVLTAAQVFGIGAHLMGFNTLPTRKEEMSHQPVNISRLQALLGWSPQTSLSEGITLTKEFLDAQETHQ